MLIEILYVPGCPHHKPAIGRLRKVLRSESVDAPIHEIRVTDEAMARSLSDCIRDWLQPEAESSS